MTVLIAIRPMTVTNVSSSRGSGADNLLTFDPKEVWADTAAGSASIINVDLGSVREIDTVFLGYVSPAAAAASWSITGGAAGASEVIQADDTLRVPDVADHSPASSHALWFGAPRQVRYLAISVTQPAGSAPLTIGVLVVGKAIVTELGQEWGGGRQPIDTGTATSLPSGGFAVVEGVRKRLLNWTFGDLSVAETDQLELLALAVGETSPGLVIEDADRTAGLRSRIHYGLFRQWRPYERRNRKQTRWEIAIEEWV
jgi:hypothetical protein